MGNVGKPGSHAGRRPSNMGNASSASAAAAGAAEDQQMQKLSSSLMSLSLRGRQLFSAEMEGEDIKTETRKVRGEKRPRDEIPTGSLHKVVQRPEDDDTSDDDSVEGKLHDEDDETPDEKSESEGIFAPSGTAIDTSLGTVPSVLGKNKVKETASRGAWTPDQDEALRIAVEKYEGKNWKAIAKEVPGNRSHIQCLQRWGKVLKPGLIKGPWTEEEDDLLRTYVPLEAKGNWVAVAEHVPGRTAKQCRERWSLCLDPAIRKDPWSPEEDELLLQLHDSYGNAWATIAKHLPGRTENATKSRFKSIERKKDRAWTPMEDAAIIRGKAEEKKWGAITAMLPKSNRTKHAVKSRWKELMEINPSLKRFDSSNRKSSSETSLTDPSLSEANKLKEPAVSDSNFSFPSFNQMAAHAAASTPPEMFSTIYVPSQPMPPPMQEESSPPHSHLMVMGDALDESASFPRMVQHTLSSDKLMNLRIQRNESFEEWLAREAGGITSVPMMSGGYVRSFDDQFGGPLLSYDDLTDLELV